MSEQKEYKPGEIMWVEGDYYDRQHERAMNAGRLIVMLALFFSGAAAGWVSALVLA